MGQLKGEVCYAVSTWASGFWSSSLWSSSWFASCYRSSSAHASPYASSSSRTSWTTVEDWFQALICAQPFIRNGREAFGCGQCMPCRLVKQRVWFHRILLEAQQHERAAFVTLTYRPECDPGSLRPDHAQEWLKRLRRRFEPRRIRFFLVGEYGDQFGRAHYHAALFNYASCGGGPVCNGVCECPACLGVRETWGFGHVFVGRLTRESARYIARYTLKKMTSREDARLGGRYPEFMRSSRRPGIGAGAMSAVASVLRRYPSKPLPGALLWSGKALPLGRYLRRKVAEKAGRSIEPYVDKTLPIVQAFAFQNNRSIRSVYQEVVGPYENRLAAKLSTELPLFTGQQQKKVVL